MGRRRSTIRLRLTALYAGAFFLAGAILIALTYVYLQQSLQNRPAGAQGIVQQFLNERGVPNRPVVDGLFSAIAAQAERERRETLQGMLVWSLVSLGAVGVVAGGFGWLLRPHIRIPVKELLEAHPALIDRQRDELLQFRLRVRTFREARRRLWRLNLQRGLQLRIAARCLDQRTVARLR
jgi:hypothetical protein